MFLCALFEPAACATEVFKIASRWVCRLCLAAICTKWFFFYIYCTCLSPCIMIPFPSPVPIYLSITTWSSMMLMASTPTLLRQKGRFVSRLYLLVHVFYSDQFTFWLRYVSLFLQENCSACSQVPMNLSLSPASKLQEVLDYLTESASL